MNKYIVIAIIVVIVLLSFVMFMMWGSRDIWTGTWYDDYHGGTIPNNLTLNGNILNIKFQEQSHNAPVVDGNKVTIAAWSATGYNDGKGVIVWKNASGTVVNTFRKKK